MVVLSISPPETHSLRTGTAETSFLREERVPGRDRLEKSWWLLISFEAEVLRMLFRSLRAPLPFKQVTGNLVLIHFLVITV